MWPEQDARLWLTPPTARLGAAGREHLSPCPEAHLLCGLRHVPWPPRSLSFPMHTEGIRKAPEGTEGSHVDDAFGTAAWHSPAPQTGWLLLLSSCRPHSLQGQGRAGEMSSKGTQMSQLPGGNAFLISTSVSVKLLIPHQPHQLLDLAFQCWGGGWRGGAAEQVAEGWRRSSLWEQLAPSPARHPPPAV